ncbi:MAG: histidine--tRNA ligase [Bacteroidales bacterium]|nr:histidine--tRNA ligase [Bacteroidales bacterium]
MKLRDKINEVEKLNFPDLKPEIKVYDKDSKEGLINIDRIFFKLQPFINDIIKKYSSLTSLSNLICEKGLRYDLTVPFARYVVQNRNDITFPFKRYQIQPVWRADRPQKGRYREFYQCDADVIGSSSLLNEIELFQIIDEVFIKLGISVTIKLNNRKILTGLAEYIGYPDKITDITIAIDKLDKIGVENVVKELEEKGLEKMAIDKLLPVFELKGNNQEKLQSMKNMLAGSESGLKGIEEMETIFNFLKTLDLKQTVELDLSLARGLNYYTGAIIEVKANDVQIGSISGGGRYDDLTGIFGMPGVSGVGISFGADRIYDVLLQLNLFPEHVAASTKILFVNFGGNELLYSLAILKKLRENAIPAEIYPDESKLKKQLGYADAKGIPYVALIGENEMNQGTITVKNMKTGAQENYSLNDLLDLVKNSFNK